MAEKLMKYADAVKKFDPVIGLETHVELSTTTKLFCPAEVSFGGDPNSQLTPVSLGLPGSLPVVNKTAVDYAIKLGLALHCEIAEWSQFARKNYFYPDNPQNYQISQLYKPICTNGYVEIKGDDGEKKQVRIHEIHMEEDAGKLVHDDWNDCSLVDLNRSGVPLIEIVSEPDMRSSDEVIAYLEKLRLIIQYLGASDCKLNEGSMRADVNLSVREYGAKEFGTRTEMKNLNSFKAIARAIENERERQIDLLESGQEVVQETRRWDDTKEYSYAMRSKEDAQDYRYFPDPDLVPINISDEWLERLKSEQPEFRDEKKERYIEEYGLPEYDANLLTLYKPLTVLLEAAVANGSKPKEASNWLMVETMRLVKEKGIEPDEVKFSADNFSKFLKLIDDNVINKTVAKEVFEAMFNDDIDPEKYVDEHELKMDNNTDDLKKIIEEVIANNPKAVADYQGGIQKAIGALVGQTMKATQGKANPQMINQMLRELL